MVQYGAAIVRVEGPVGHPGELIFFSVVSVRVMVYGAVLEYVVQCCLMKDSMVQWVLECVWATKNRRPSNP